MDKLKPCPFCGGEAILTHIPNGIYTVECQKCSAMMGRNHKTYNSLHSKTHTHIESIEEAQEAWNRRVDHDTN